MLSSCRGAITTAAEGDEGETGRARGAAAFSMQAMGWTEEEFDETRQLKVSNSSMPINLSSEMDAECLM